VQPNQVCTFFLLGLQDTGHKIVATRFLVKDLLSVLDSFAPFELAESWDNIGLMVGDPAQPVSSILVALDPTPDLLGEAEASGANVILTHHPLIFHPLHSLRLDYPVGRILAEALRKKIAIISCHTNLDVIRQGVSDELAFLLGLSDSEPLLALERGSKGIAGPLGFGRIGNLPASVAGEDLLNRICTALDVEIVKVAGSLPEEISRIAVCGGSGSSLVETAWHQGAQIFVTGEIKHSEARWAEANDFCLIDAGHYATEKVVIPALVASLGRSLADLGQELSVRASLAQGSPFRYRSPQGASVRLGG
jgi:dinuclear metal center YbgI/SA1388 family protein